VDTWNEKIKLLNPATPHPLFSRDRLCEVDDPNGFLASMLTEDILNKFNNAGIMLEFHLMNSLSKKMISASSFEILTNHLG